MEQPVQQPMPDYAPHWFDQHDAAFPAAPPKQYDQEGE